MKKFKNYLIPVIIIIFGLLVGFTTTNCGNINSSRINGNGKIISDERKVSDFNAIDASGAFNIVLNEGNENKIKIDGDENIIKHIYTEVKDSTLKIFTDNSVKNYKKLNIFITYQKLASIESDGACMITGNSEIKTEHFSIKLSGATDLTLKLSVAYLNAVLSGTGSVNITGNADKQNVELSGTSSFNALNLVTNTTTIDLSGVGSAEINALKEINGDLSGVGSIHYKGEPPVKNINISGLGSFSKI
jgi:hypothetical protein